MKYLITGGAGFIGSNLADKLIKDGHKVAIIDNLSTGKKENLNSKADFYKLDIRDFEKIKNVFRGVDCVFHFAAIPSVPISIKDPVVTSDVNIMGTVNVFKAGVDQKVRKIVFASSSAVYGEQKSFPLKEDMTPNPSSPYGLQKLVGEQFAKQFGMLYGIEIVCLRYFNVYGPKIDFGSDYSLVIGKFLKLKAENRPLTIFGDGKQTRAFCYIDDVVDANIKAARSKKIKGGEAINVGHEKSYSVNFLAKLVGGKIVHLEERKGDVLHSQSDISLAKKLLGWSPKVEFEKGVKATSEWFKNNSAV